MSARLRDAEVPWLVAGGAGRALLGWSARPGDIDVEVAAEDADRAARALGVHLADDTARGWRSKRGRLTIRGVEVDVTAGLVTGDDAPGVAEILARAVPVGWAAGTILVMAPRDALLRALASPESGTAERLAGTAPAEWRAALER